VTSAIWSSLVVFGVLDNSKVHGTGYPTGYQAQHHHDGAHILQRSCADTLRRLRDGERRNIRKASLREWRSRFAEQLREHGISANATERAARGESRYLRDHWRRIQREMRAGGLQPNPGKAKIVETRRAVVAGYHSAAEVLLQSGQADLARKILSFVEGMSPPRTTDEHLVAAVARRSREPPTLAPREYSSHPLRRQGLTRLCSSPWNIDKRLIEMYFRISRNAKQRD
jgi:hypothetical protein